MVALPGGSMPHPSRRPRRCTRRSLDGRFRAALGLVALGLVALGPVACGDPTPGEFGAPGPIALEEVEAPADLQSLDQTVRDQYAEFWSALEAASSDDARPPAERADAWGDLGRWFDVYQYPQSAARCYRNARALDPSEPRWPYYLGRLATVAGDLDEASRQFGVAAELAPEETGPRLRLGDLALERRDLDAAATAYAEILARHPDDAGALLGTARLALLRGDGGAALDALELLERQQPEASKVQYMLGLAHRLLGDEDAASTHFAAVPEENVEQRRLVLDTPWDQELLQLNRGAQALTRRGLRARLHGDDEGAVRLFGAAVAADPEAAETRINFALALQRVGRARAALEQLERAVELADAGSPLQAKAHLELGRLLAGPRPVAAREHLETALALRPGSADVHAELGRLELLRDRPEAALEHYAAARGDERPRPAAAFWHAALLSSLGRHREALEALEADLERFGAARDLRLLHARLLVAAPDPALHDRPRADRLLATSDEEIDVRDDVRYDVLYAETAAMVSAAHGRFDEAVAWQEAAIAVLDTLPRHRLGHPARRRLALYRDHRPCATPWETEERRLVAAPVIAPGQGQVSR